MKTYCDSVTHSVSRLRSYLQRMRISKCLPPQGNSPDTSRWEDTRLLLFFNAFVCGPLFTWHIAGKSRFFYGYNYNCKFSTCQAYFKNFTFYAFYSTLFSDSTMSIVFSLKCITPFTTMEKILVRIALYKKLIGLMLLPNITASTSTVVITYL